MVFAILIAVLFGYFLVKALTGIHAVLWVTKHRKPEPRKSVFDASKW